MGTFGAETVQVPRARIQDADGRSREWRSRALPRYQRLTKTAEALITAVYLSGTNTRRVKRALTSSTSAMMPETRACCAQLVSYPAALKKL